MSLRNVTLHVDKVWARRYRAPNDARSDRSPSTTNGVHPMLGDVAGIGQLKSSLEDMKGSLAHTNDLLEAVLMELRQLNGERMALMVDQLQAMNEQLMKSGALTAL